MKILFMTIGGFKDLNSQGIYSDLMREFIANGHSVYIACANQEGDRTYIDNQSGVDVLRVSTGKVTKTNLIKKGLSTLMIETQFKKAIKKYYCNLKFDLVLYPTPPITFFSAVNFVKKRDNAKTYLLLKDIFPQNAVDLGMMTPKGPKSIIYKIFKRKEEKLYKVSDYIGCMSQANVDYLLKHNEYINPEIVHINPNSIEVEEIVRTEEKRCEIREKYNMPQDAKVFVYGGNLGKPQDIPFFIKCLRANVGKTDRFFVICGKGTEYSKLKNFVDGEKPDNVLLLNGLPKEEYEEFIRAFDIGLIFLDHRFEIPNFPSRLLSYMQNSMPVIACTDPNTDVGKVITDGEFGWWCESNSTEDFTSVVDKACEADIDQMGRKAYEFLINNYTSKRSYETIISKIGD